MFRNINGQPNTKSEQILMGRKAGLSSARSRWGYTPVLNKKQREIWFWKKVNKSSKDNCWIWKPSKGRNRYFTIRDVLEKRHVGVHVLSLEIKLGRRLKQGMIALHSCDQRNCVNPHHLFEGTYEQNTQDMIRKNRHSHGAKHAALIKAAVDQTGENNGNSKLTNQQARKVIKLYSTGLYTLKKLGAMFGVTRQAVAYTIKQRKGI